MHFVFNLTGKCFMRIDIRTMGIMLTSSLREYIERRLQFALGWASHGVHKIIENMESDLHVAIDRAAPGRARVSAPTGSFAQP